jgi:serine/threonine-protein kinase HipA
MSELLALVDGELLGRVRSDRHGLLTFEYEPTWLNLDHAFPLSVSMPLAPQMYRQQIIRPFLWNLLPENTHVLDRWGQQFQVSPNNPFKLLMNVGEDVPGAAQFVSPERFLEFCGEVSPAIAWISHAELIERMQRLRGDYAAFRLPDDRGRMSLPGAQAKTAMYFDGTRWGVPSGRTPTTHILKPCIPGFPGLVENEHLCQDIAARCGLLAAKSFVLELDEPVIVVERFDRLPPVTGSAYYRRVHQEDLCQAQSLLPSSKYQEQGGPGIKRIVALLRAVSSSPDEDVDRFVDANIYNWFIGGTDAHAKNYSLLIASGNEIRLAPLYDVSSQLPYQDLIHQRLAMKIGERYDIPRINLADWRHLARSCRIDEGRMISRLKDLGRSLPDHIADAGKQTLRQGLSKKYVAPFSEQLITHVEQRLAKIK